MCGLRGKEGEWLETKVLELGCLGSKPTSALTLSSHAAIFCLQSEEDIFSHTEDWEAQTTGYIRTQGLQVERAQEMSASCTPESDGWKANPVTC